MYKSCLEIIDIGISYSTSKKSPIELLIIIRKIDVLNNPSSVFSIFKGISNYENFKIESLRDKKKSLINSEQRNINGNFFVSRKISSAGSKKYYQKSSETINVFKLNTSALSKTALKKSIDLSLTLSGATLGEKKILISLIYKILEKKSGINNINSSTLDFSKAVSVSDSLYKKLELFFKENALYSAKKLHYSSELDSKIQYSYKIESNLIVKKSEYDFNNLYIDDIDADIIKHEFSKLNLKR
ncbi:hypothetical protein PCANB_000116 [Pneumocystis canis]|nr:hypothetical protein PCANB_000116 [Pneumocystis canis]